MSRNKDLAEETYTLTSDDSVDVEKAPNNLDISTIQSDIKNIENSQPEETKVNSPELYIKSDEAIEDKNEPNEPIQRSGESIVVSPISPHSQLSLTNDTITLQNNPLSSLSLKHTKNVLPSTVETFLSYSGAHATNINISPEDIEYNKSLDDFPQADFSTISSVSSLVVEYIQTSATATIKNNIDISKISSFFESEPSVSESENEHAQEMQPTRGDEVFAAESKPDNNFEVIDGTTIFLKPESTVEIKESVQKIESTMSPSLSMSSSNIQQNDKISSTIIMSTSSMSFDQPNGQAFDGDKMISKTPISREEKDLSMSSIQNLDKEDISSPTIDIQPSITQQLSEPGTFTPELDPNFSKGDSNEVKKLPSVENIPRATSSIPAKHVSTDNAADFTLESIPTENANDDFADATKTQNINGYDLSVITGTEMPTRDTKKSDEVELRPLSKNDGAEYEAEDKFQNEGAELSSISGDSPVSKINSEMMDETSASETLQEDFDDTEEQDDDDEIESEEVKEERKKIIQQSLQVEPQSYEEESKDANSLADNIEENDSTLNPDNSAQSIDITRNKIDEISQKNVNDVKNDNNDSNDDKEKFEHSFVSSEHESIDNQKNDDTLDTEEGNKEREIDEIPEHVTIQFDNDDTFDRRPGDDIKFYEPGDMIQNESELKLTDNMNSFSGLETSNNEINEEKESKLFKAENNGKICYD